MGQSMSALFGGGGADIPDAPKYEAPPQSLDAEGESTRDAERKKLRARAGGIKSTLLGQQLGPTSRSGSNPMGLLGRSIS